MGCGFRAARWVPGAVTVSLDGGAHSSSGDASAAGRISLALIASTIDGTNGLAAVRSPHIHARRVCAHRTPDGGCCVAKLELL